eukprot:PhM_4_TR12807/c0_g2_i1/m.33784
MLSPREAVDFIPFSLTVPRSDRVVNLSCEFYPPTKSALVGTKDLFRYLSALLSIEFQSDAIVDSIVGFAVYDDDALGSGAWVPFTDISQLCRGTQMFCIVDVAQGHDDRHQPVSAVPDPTPSKLTTYRAVFDRMKTDTSIMTPEFIRAAEAVLGNNNNSNSDACLAWYDFVEVCRRYPNMMNHLYHTTFMAKEHAESNARLSGEIQRNGKHRRSVEMQLTALRMDMAREQAEAATRRMGELESREVELMQRLEAERARGRTQMYI